MNKIEKALLETLKDVDSQKKTAFEQYQIALKNQDTLYEGFFSGTENGLSLARNLICKYFVVQFGK